LFGWTRYQLGQAIYDCAKAYGINLGKLGQPIRVAIAGGPVSPPIDVTLALVGRERSLRRLDQAISLIKERAAAS
jgi:glutamyl-tRNA synthetase